MKGEAAYTNVIVFDLTRLEPMIYCTRGDHANHYTIDVVPSHLESTTKGIK